MEDKSHHDEPMNMSYRFLKEITADFKEENRLGSGTFGDVFKGVLKDDKVIAVKMLKLRWIDQFSEKQFINEFKLLEKLNHQNIVQLVGFCNDIEKIPTKFEGKEVIADKIHRALCLEFLPNGSLGDLLKEQSLVFDWDMRLKIIRDICQGLRYLHEQKIQHFDLKPDNILIADKMQAKIADFGISRIVCTEKTLLTDSSLGTIGYMPPEFIDQQIISYQYDIFSLGVIIQKIVDSRISDMDDKEFIGQVLEKWNKRFQEIPGYTSLDVEVCNKQARTCIEIAAECMKTDWRNRPTMDEIVDKVNEIETVEAARLRMMFKDDEKPPRNKQRIKGDSSSDLVTMKPVKYLKKNALLTADTVTVELELNASTSPTTAREKIDLVVLLDVSGSMGSETIDDVKNAIKFVIMELTPLDRFSVVTFSDSATRHCPLRCMTQSAQDDLKAIVDGLDLAKSVNRTNIQTGLQTAMAVLNGRVNEKARLSKIFLVSVRQQDDGDARLVSLGKVGVYTFGFDKVEDDKLLYDIANESSGGTFTSLADKTDISMAFAAGLVTPVAHNVRLKLTPQMDFGDLDTMMVTPATEYKQTTDRATGVITIKVGDFFSGDVHRVVVNLTLLPSKDAIEYDAVLALAQHSYAVQNGLRNGTTQSIKINRTMNPTELAGHVFSVDLI